MGKKAKKRLHQLTRPDLSLVESDHLVAALRERFPGGGFVLIGEYQQEDGLYYRRHFGGDEKIVKRILRQHGKFILRMLRDDGE